MSNLINRLFRGVFTTSLFSIPVLVPVAVFAGTANDLGVRNEARIMAAEIKVIQQTAETFVEGKITCDSNQTGKECGLLVRDNRTGKVFSIENPEKVRGMMGANTTEYRIKGLRLGSRLEVLTVTALNAGSTENAGNGSNAASTEKNTTGG